MRTLPLVLCTAALTLAACNQEKDTQETAMTSDTPQAAGAPVLDGIVMNRLDGTPESLSDAYAGKTILIVNTASRCGLTPQYEGLEALYRDRQDEGLVVLGFPANDFMGQEPGTNAEIAAFCRQNYGVSFPMYEKISVTGDDAHELFVRLSAETGAPSWNFTKYLITPDGTVTRFDPRTSPDDPGLRAAIDGALASS